MTSGLSWDRPNPFTISVRVDAADVDSYGHVNNVVYIAWLERCAWAHSAAVGVPEARCVAMGHGMAVRSIRANYLAACFDGDLVEIANWIVANDGRLRATRRFQLFNHTRETVVMRAEIDYVCMNLKTGRATRMPAEFKSAYPVAAC